MSRLSKRLRTAAWRAINRLPIQQAVASRLEEVAALRAKTRELDHLQTELASRASASAELEATSREVQTQCAQLQDVIKRMGGLVPPPPHLQIRVCGVYDAHFVRHGSSLLEQLKAALSRIDRDLGSFESILDFGCGCGRILAPLHYQRKPSQRIYATDIDAEAVGWCRENYAQVAEFSVNTEMPPLAYGADTFDLVYSVSIFTHLPEEMHFAWLNELRRITRPGGYLLLSTHGKRHIDALPQAERDLARKNGFHYFEVGGTEGLPGFYQFACHTPEYIRSRWSRIFEIVDVQERAIDDSQDLVICRARD